MSFEGTKAKLLTEDDMSFSLVKEMTLKFGYYTEPRCWWIPKSIQLISDFDLATPNSITDSAVEISRVFFFF